MKREYDTGEQESITYFTGVEIEQTPAFGMRTLFVVYNVLKRLML